MNNQNKIIFKETILQKIKTIINFVKKPDNNLTRSYDIKKNFRSVLAFYLIHLFFLILWVIIVTPLVDLHRPAASKIREMMSPLNFMLYALIIGPILEETIFRLSLVFKPKYLSISILLLSYVLISRLGYGVGHLDIEEHLWVRIIISVLISMITYFLSKRYSTNFAKFWDINFRWIYYFSIIVFALLHLDFTELTFNKFLLFPFLTFPQLLSGTINGYIRIKYGFIYSCLFHGLNNTLPGLFHL
ncbi:hypothetical protein [Eudoraea sp.]|uniref:hypothetical protein n=1 Tax=Eudoraea sp. TaxID=1979955 RepID=UPI003C740D50